MYLPGPGLNPWVLETVPGSGVNPQTIPELKHIAARPVSMGAVTLPSRGLLAVWGDTCEEGFTIKCGDWAGRVNILT